MNYDVCERCLTGDLAVSTVKLCWFNTDYSQPRRSDVADDEAELCLDCTTELERWIKDEK